MKQPFAVPRRLAPIGLALSAVVGAACSAHLGSASTATTTAVRTDQPAPVVQVSHDQFGAHAEPAVAANRTNPNNLLAATMVYQSSARGLATYASLDRGRTWRSNGLLPGAGIDYDADVTVTFDPEGHGFVSGWVGNQAHPDQGGVRVWRTDDGGRSFRPPVLAVSGFMDHPALASDPTSASQGLYLAGTFTAGSGLRFTRSTDDGNSFEPTRVIDPTNGTQGRLPVISAGLNGLVAVMYYVFQPDGTPVATVVTSTDHGQTFGRPTALSPVQSPTDITEVNARGGPALTADPKTGDLYAAITTTNAGTSELDVYASHDYGNSWTPAVTVARSTSATYFQAQLTVDNSGRVGLFTFEFISGAVEPLVYTSQPKTTTFGPAHRLTAAGFNPQAGLVAGTSGDAGNSNGPAWIGDYQAIAVTPGEFHPVWNDGTPGSLQLMTTTVA